jgi:hypothetical protein
LIRGGLAVKASGALISLAWISSLVYSVGWSCAEVDDELRLVAVEVAVRDVALGDVEFVLQPSIDTPASVVAATNPATAVRDVLVVPPSVPPKSSTSSRG